MSAIDDVHISDDTGRADRLLRWDAVVFTVDTRSRSRAILFGDA